MRGIYVVAVAGLVACGHEAQGVWVLELHPDDAGRTCATTVDSENFTDASPIEQDGGDTGGDWTTSEETSTTGQLVFVQIVNGPEKDSWLVVQGQTYPGTHDGKDWTFQWEDKTTTTDTATHTSGYAYSQEQADSTRSTFTFTVDNHRLTGTWTDTATETVTYAESDTWTGNDVGFNNGRLPAGDWLELGNGDPAQNKAGQTDCDADPCQLVVKTACTQSSDVQGSLTDYDPQDYAAIEDATSP